jgi:hypothetical protein
MRVTRSRPSLRIFIVFSSPVQAQVSFFQTPTFPNCSSSSYANLFVADFNGDGKPDLLCSDGTLSLGNGDGTFTLSTPVSLNNSQGIAAVADFNGDGKADVLETGPSGTLLVLLGNGDGTFQAPVSSVGAIFQPVATVDLNGDGKADVVGIYAGNPNGTLNVCISNGDGTFKQGVPYSLGSTGYASAVSAGDFNGDGRLDVAVYTATQVLSSSETAHCSHPKLLWALPITHLMACFMWLQQTSIGTASWTWPSEGDAAHRFASPGRYTLCWGMEMGRSKRHKLPSPILDLLSQLMSMETGSLI